MVTISYPRPNRRQKGKINLMQNSGSDSLEQNFVFLPIGGIIQENS